MRPRVPPAAADVQPPAQPPAPPAPAEASGAAQGEVAQTEGASVSDLLRAIQEAEGRMQDAAEQGAATAQPQPSGVELTGLGVVPLTRADVQALRGRRERLSDQLLSAQGRREDVVEELDAATSDVVRTGLEQRLTVLDNLIARLEQDIDANGQLLASAEANYPAATSPPPPPPKTFTDMAEEALPFGFLLLLPVALAVTRLLWKRGNKPRAVPISPAAEARFTKLEQAIDAVALETERTAESQRFMTKLLREGKPLPDFAAAARAGNEAAPVRASDG